MSDTETLNPTHRPMPMAMVANGAGTHVVCTHKCKCEPANQETLIHNPYFQLVLMGVKVNRGRVGS